MSLALGEGRNPSGLLHTILRHRSRDELVSQAVPFAREALGVGDPLFVTLAPASLSALRSALGRDADRIRWSDSTRWSPHPMRRLRSIRELVEGAERHGVGRVRILGDVPPSAVVPGMVAEWERSCSLLNLALAGHPATVACVYDESALPAGIAERAPCSHPYLGLAPTASSQAYLEPEAFMDRHRPERVPPPAGSPSLSGTTGPAEARAFVRRALGQDGTTDPVPQGVIEDVVTAVHEAVTNAWQAGASSVTVTCWREAGEVGAQVDDDGPGLRDPLAGRRWPDPHTERGRGLWVARQLVDVVDVAASGSGTSVRVRVFDAGWARPAA